MNLSRAVLCSLLLLPPAVRAVEDFPRIYDTEKGAPMSAEEAAATMELPPGFKCVVFAAEPDVRQPIAMNWDSKGRLWVAENYTYAENPRRWDTSLRDRIIILEDRDGDGRHDVRKVFWDRGSQLTSVEIGYGGAWILNAGTLSFIADENGDDAPDSEPEVLLDGFNVKTIGHNIVNGLRWGPDGWLYGRHGITDTSSIGAPGTPAQKRVKMNCGIWRFHPVRKVFEVVCHGGTNAWGHDWNAEGELFYINTVIGHLWHVIPGGYYRRMFGTHLNPYVYEIIEQTADHFHWDTGAESWGDIRKLGVTQRTDQLGGGHAHVGMLIYQGGVWPEQYEGTVLACNLHGNRINMDTLHREGCGYTARHAPDFMKAKDKWFRGVEILTGPDGNVFVADWSDSGECHDNDGIHRSSGRIYKIVYGESRKPVRSARNNWWTRMDLQRAHENGTAPAPAPEPVIADARSADGLVRLRLASSMQRRPLDERWPIATALASNADDADDRQQPLMIWYGIEPAVAADPMKGVALIGEARIPTVRRLVARRIAEMIDTKPEAVNALVALMDARAEVRGDVLAGIAAGLDGFSSAKRPEGWSDALVEKWVRDAGPGEAAKDEKTPSLRSIVTRLSVVFGSGRAEGELIAIVKDAGGDANARRNAFASLTRSAKPELLGVIRGLINDKVLGAAARAALAAYDDPAIPTQLVGAWPARSEEMQAATVATLVTRAGYARVLLEAVKSGRVPSSAISPFHARQIRSLGDGALGALLTEAWGELRDTPEAKKAEFARWEAVLKPQALAAADQSKGRMIFNSACGACHKMYGQGGAIGPELTGSDRRNLKYLLENILDPNAVVPADFRMSIFQLKDGRTLSGVIPEQSEHALTVQTPGERLRIERSQILKREQLSQSLMPEGLLGALGEESALALIAYLMGEGQVPLPK